MPVLVGVKNNAYICSVNNNKQLNKMKNNLKNTLNFYREQVQLYKELGDTHRTKLYQETVEQYEETLSVFDNLNTIL